MEVNSTIKAGTILINRDSKKVALVYREKYDDYSFPKGHLEENESIKECAIRETEEETGRECQIIDDFEIIETYETPRGENVKCYYYIAEDIKPYDEEIEEELKEKCIWVDLNEVYDRLSYDNLKKVWNDAKYRICELLIDVIEPKDLTDLGICPTCFNKEHDEKIYGDNTEKMIYENDKFECFLVGNPREKGHTAISSKQHFKDMMEIDDELCKEIFVFAKNMMNIIKDVYEAESVYLCTMCDGPMNHFHLQLIPRYSYEKRGSKNFVKPRMEYIQDEEKINKMRERINKVQ